MNQPAARLVLQGLCALLLGDLTGAQRREGSSGGAGRGAEVYTSALLRGGVTIVWEKANSAPFFNCQLSTQMSLLPRTDY